MKYENAKINQHALVVSVFKVLKNDTVMDEEEEEEEAEEEKSNHTLAVQLLSRAKCPPPICDHRATASARTEKESGNAFCCCLKIYLSFLRKACLKLS